MDNRRKICRFIFNILVISILGLLFTSSISANDQPEIVFINFDRLNYTEAELGQSIMDLFAIYGYDVRFGSSDQADILINKIYFPGLQQYQKYLNSVLNQDISDMGNWDQIIELLDIKRNETIHQNVIELPIVYQQDILYRYNGAENISIFDPITNIDNFMINDFLIRTDLPSRDPLQLNSSIDYGLINMGFNPLSMINDVGGMYGIGATNWQILSLDDMETHTISIREGMKYRDGTPITVEDYIFSMKIMAMNKVNTPKSDIYDLIDKFDWDKNSNEIIIETARTTLLERQQLMQITPTPLYLNSTHTYEIDQSEFLYSVFADVLDIMDSKEWNAYESGSILSGIFGISNIDEDSVDLLINPYWNETILTEILPGLIDHNPISIKASETLSFNLMNTSYIAENLDSIEGIIVLSGKDMDSIEEKYSTLRRGYIYSLTGDIVNIKLINDNIELLIDEINEMNSNNVVGINSWLPDYHSNIQLVKSDKPVILQSVETINTNETKTIKATRSEFKVNIRGNIVIGMILLMVLRGTTKLTINNNKKSVILVFILNHFNHIN